jgi:hypothetical protein
MLVTKCHKGLRTWIDSLDKRQILVGKPERKRLLGSPRRKWVNNIKMDLSETGWGGMDWLIWLRIGTSGGAL